MTEIIVGWLLRTVFSVGAAEAAVLAPKIISLVTNAVAFIKALKAAGITPESAAKAAGEVFIAIAPRKMTPDEERIWMERGTVPADATNDFPQIPV